MDDGLPGSRRTSRRALAALALLIVALSGGTAACTVSSDARLPPGGGNGSSSTAPVRPVALAGLSSASPPSAPVPAARAGLLTATPSVTDAPLDPPDATFAAQECAPTEACRRMAVQRIAAIPFTRPVPCSAGGTSCQLTLDLYFPSAPASDAAGYPIAVFASGGPASPATRGSVFGPLLASQGVVVIDGSWRQTPTFGGGATIGVRDIACTILAARELGPRVGGAAGRVTLIGHSLGGWAGSVVALTPGGVAPSDDCRFPAGNSSPDAFAGLSGDYSEIDSSANDLDWQPIVGSVRATDPDTWAALDPLALLRGNTARTLPILLAHGDTDDVVPIAESRAFAAALTNAGRPTTVVVEPGVAHGDILVTPTTITLLLRLLHVADGPPRSS